MLTTDDIAEVSKGDGETEVGQGVGEGYPGGRAGGVEVDGDAIEGCCYD